MSDTHGVYRPAWYVEDPALDTEEGRIVAPEATSYMVTKEWLENVRSAARHAKVVTNNEEALDGIIAATEQFLPPVPATPRQLVLEVLGYHYGDESRNLEIFEDVATDVMKALRDGGWKVVRDAE